MKLKREMSLYRYFKPVRKLPDPNGDLSTIIPPSVIREANKEVAMAVEATEDRKRKPYKKISDSLRAQIGRYALKKWQRSCRCFTKECTCTHHRNTHAHEQIITSTIACFVNFSSVNISQEF